MATELAERISAAMRSLGSSHVVTVVRLDAESWIRRQILQPPQPDIEVSEQPAGVRIVFPVLGWRSMGGTPALLLICGLLAVPVLLLAADLVSMSHRSSTRSASSLCHC